MIVAMIAVRMMQMAVDQVIDMVAVRDGRMSAIRAMHVAGLMRLRSRAPACKRPDWSPIRR